MDEVICEIKYKKVCCDKFYYDYFLYFFIAIFNEGLIKAKDISIDNQYHFSSIDEKINVT